MDRPDDAALLAEADDYRAASGKPWRVLIPELTAALRAALQREQEKDEVYFRLLRTHNANRATIAAQANELTLARETAEAKMGPVDGTLTSIVVRLLQSHEAAERELSTLRARTEQEDTRSDQSGEAIADPRAEERGR